MKRLRACVLGATGIIGQHFLRLLEDHPYFELAAVTASQRSEGKRYGAATDWIVTGNIPEDVGNLTVQATTTQAVLEQEPDIVFSALPSGVAYDIEAKLAREGLPVFSNAEPHRMEPNVPILMPEVNPDHLELVKSQDYGDGFIVTNSNCSTSGLVLALKPLANFNILQVIVTTYQAVSGAGRKGVASLDILGNVIPFIPKEEDKIVRETCKILGTLENGTIRPAAFEVNASCARVPVVDGHLESVVVDFEDPIGLDDIAHALTSFRGQPQEIGLPTAPLHPLVVMSENDRPQPRRDLSLTEGDFGMSVKVGRLRSHGSRLNMFLLVHNTIRGAAGASVLNAEFASAKGVIR